MEDDKIQNNLNPQKIFEEAFSAGTTFIGSAKKRKICYHFYSRKFRKENGRSKRANALHDFITKELLVLEKRASWFIDPATKQKSKNGRAAVYSINPKYQYFWDKLNGITIAQLEEKISKHLPDPKNMLKDLRTLQRLEPSGNYNYLLQMIWEYKSFDPRVFGAKETNRIIYQKLQLTKKQRAILFQGEIEHDINNCFPQVLCTWARANDCIDQYPYLQAFDKQDRSGIDKLRSIIAKKSFLNGKPLTVPQVKKELLSSLHGGTSRASGLIEKVIEDLISVRDRMIKNQTKCGTIRNIFGDRKRVNLQTKKGKGQAFSFLAHSSLVSFQEKARGKNPYYCLDGVILPQACFSLSDGSFQITMNTLEIPHICVTGDQYGNKMNDTRLKKRRKRTI